MNKYEKLEEKYTDKRIECLKLRAEIIRLRYEIMNLKEQIESPAGRCIKPNFMEQN